MSDTPTPEQLEKAKRWDEAMNRAFKGIVSRPQRHLFLEKALKRAE